MNWLIYPFSSVDENSALGMAGSNVTVDYLFATANSAKL